MVRRKQGNLRPTPSPAVKSVTRKKKVAKKKASPKKKKVAKKKAAPRRKASKPDQDTWTTEVKPGDPPDTHTVLQQRYQESREEQIRNATRHTQPGERGRPSKYHSGLDEMTTNYCLLGCTNTELALFLGISDATLDNWMANHPSFLGAIKAGREEADAHVAGSLYHRARGYSHREDKIFNDNGTPMIVPTVKHYAPDTRAAKFWLMNRHRGKWCEESTTKVTGADGGPAEIVVIKRVITADN